MWFTEVSQNILFTETEKGAVMRHYFFKTKGIMSFRRENYYLVNI